MMVTLVHKLGMVTLVVAIYVFLLAIGIAFEIAGHWFSIKFALASKKRSVTRFANRRKALLFLTIGSLTVPTMIWIIALHTTPNTSTNSATPSAVVLSFLLCVFGYFGLITGGFFLSSWTTERVNGAK
jgi:hypothetical protein